MRPSTTDIARDGEAPEPTHCIVLGEGDSVRIAFLAGEDTGAPVSLLSAVTLTRSQLSGFAGMVAAILDVDDPYAVSSS